MYSRLLQYLKPHKRRFFAALGAMALFGATDGCIPLLLKHILDDVFVSHREDKLWVLVQLLALLAFARAGFGFMQKYLSMQVGLRIVEDLRNTIARKLLTLSPSFYGSSSTGALISRVTNDSLLVKSAVTDASVGILRDSIRVIALVSAALYLDPFLGGIALIAFPLGILPIAKFGKKVRRLSRSGQDRLGGLTSILHEMIVGHRVVQAFRMEDKEAARFAEENARATQNFIKAEKYGALSAPTNELIASVAIGVIIIYGGYSVIEGTRTQGDFMAFITAMLLMYEPLKRFSRLNNTIQTGLAAASRIFAVLDLDPDIQESPNAIRLETSEPHISFKEIHFDYRSPIALSGVSLEVTPGQTVALVGESGSGKTTLANLLPRFYDPQSGQIEIDGTNIKDFSLHSLREHIAVVDQHTFLFDSTIVDNIRYGMPTASIADVEKAAAAANAADFIERLPNGYDTKIGEQGLRLSGGQRARLAIARALLQNAPILILDEATASLDSESERLVQEAIERLMIGRTVLVIAHRLATVRHADQILVLSQGKVVERGNHEELFKLGKIYTKLCKLQFLDESGENEKIAKVSATSH
ncbi:UNVERIFIED_CONTAM: hypothetical protein GTU68_008329 [Idotea baltica]|nr:hypothetical protein [Idotea baltica]